MKLFTSVLASALMSLGLSLSAAAHEVIYAAPLLGSSEFPAAATSGLGTAKVTIDLDLLTMRVEVTFADLLGTTTAAHIHCCKVPNGPLNVSVATQLPTFVGFPLGVKAGAYDHTFDMALASSYNPAFVTANGSVGGAFNALVAGLDGDPNDNLAEGFAYLNIHTTSFPGGEIRALLAPVPVPGAMVLLAPALGVVALARRRRR